MQPSPQSDALLVLLPLLIVLSTFLFLLLSFLICALIIRRRRGIILRDNDGPVDMSREELVEGDGGFENLEARWLEGVDDNVRRAYLRGKGRSPRKSLSASFADSCRHQSTRYSIPPIPFLQTSLSRSFSPSKRKGSLPGVSNPTTRPSIPFLSTPEQKLLSSLIPLLPRVSSQICPFLSSMRCITGR